MSDLGELLGAGLTLPKGMKAMAAEIERLNQNVRALALALEEAQAEIEQLRKELTSLR